MIPLKKRQVLQLPVVLSISFVITLIFIGSSIALHLSGFIPFAPAAHAAPFSSCAAAKGTQQALCEHQDPIAQRCVADAETRDLQTVFQDHQQTKPLGEVELRYSPTCNTYWTRATAFATTTSVFKAVHAYLVFHDRQKEDSVGTPTVPGTLTPYVVWTDMTTAPLPPQAASDSFNLFGQSQPITVGLKE